MSVIESTIVQDTDVEDADQTLKTLERAEQLRAEREDGAERPDWLPEGFDTVEAFLQDYNTLKQGTEPGDEAEADESEDETDDEHQDDQEQEGEALEGLDLDALTSEFIESGTLSEETFEVLEQQGIPRELAEVHMDGLRARAELTEMKAGQLVGGSENLRAILQWAGEALPSREVDRINGLIAAADYDGYLDALEGVKARYEAAYGSLDAEQILGEQVSVADVYGSTEEMKADMRDPRYQRDEAFRAMVAAKVARTRRVNG